MNTFTMDEPYGKRPIRSLGLYETGGWRIKTYGIAYGRKTPRPELVDTARALATEVFPRPAEGGGRHGVGFLGIHDGRGANFLFADWWADENELYHRVFVATGTDRAGFEEKTATGPAACVWDLAVICHERFAWLRHVLRNQETGRPDLDAYVADVLNVDV